MTTRGLHIITDFIWTENEEMTNESLHYKLYTEIEKIIEKTTLKIVHKNMCFLPLNGYESDLGATIFYQLDSSHISLHTYYYEDNGLIAIDIFGCGKTDLVAVLKEITDLLESINSSMKMTFRFTVPRFHEF